MGRRTDQIGGRVELSGKVALVTGSSRGIGREAAQETLASLEGGPHAAFAADVADAGSARSLVEGVAREMGGIDVLVNSAAIFEAPPVAEVDYEGWQDAWSRTVATNLIGPANLSFLAARIMIGRGGGRVVNVSSRGAFRGKPETPAYGASKAGLNAMSQSMAQALAPHGVYFYVVAPGFVETDMAAPLLRGPEGEGIRGPESTRARRHPRGGRADGGVSCPLLGFACEEHTNGGVGSDPTVGVCWDADRLNLWRVGRRPDPRLLSTEAARSGERIAWARDLQREHFAWEQLYRGFGLG